MMKTIEMKNIRFSQSNSNLPLCNKALYTIIKLVFFIIVFFTPTFIQVSNFALGGNTNPVIQTWGPININFYNFTNKSVQVIIPYFYNSTDSELFTYGIFNSPSLPIVPARNNINPGFYKLSLPLQTTTPNNPAVGGMNTIAYNYHGIFFDLNGESSPSYNTQYNCGISNYPGSGWPPGIISTASNFTSASGNVPDVLNVNVGISESANNTMIFSFQYQLTFKNTTVNPLTISSFFNSTNRILNC